MTAHKTQTVLCLILMVGKEKPEMQKRSTGRLATLLGLSEIKVILGIQPSWVLKGVSKNYIFLTPEDKWVSSSTWQISYLQELNSHNKSSG